MTTPQTAVPQPTKGGSYTLDPATGDLVRVAYSRTPDQAAATAAAPSNPPQPE